MSHDHGGSEKMGDVAILGIKGQKISSHPYFKLSGKLVIFLPLYVLFHGGYYESSA